jgi:DNA repair exonuclease SbcCD nuclease subunit
MKFIHTADLHLDSKIETLPSDKSKTRREEVVHAFERLADYATENGITAVIIAGDMFDTARVTLKTRGRIIQAISKNNGVDFLYLSGNHDAYNFIDNADDLPENLKIFKDEWTSFRYGNVVISGIKLVGANFKMVCDTLNLDKNDVNIVTLHGQAYFYENNAENITISALKDKNIDYLALGHVHAYSNGDVDYRGKYAYSGSLEGRGFDETGVRGFIELNVVDNKVQTCFVKFSEREFYEHEFSVENASDWYQVREEIIKILTEKYPAKSVLRLVLVGGRNTEFDIDKENLELRLNERFFFAKVYDRTKIKVDINDYATDKSVRGEFVRAVWDSNLDEEMKGKVIMCGLNALKGEEF